MTFYKRSESTSDWEIYNSISYNVKDFTNFKTDLFTVKGVKNWGNFSYYNVGYTSGGYDKQIYGITLSDFRTYQENNGDPTNRNIYLI